MKSRWATLYPTSRSGADPRGLESAMLVALEGNTQPM